MRIIPVLAFMAMIWPHLLTANEVGPLIPRYSQQVLQVNLSDIAGMEMVKQDLIRNVNRQVGLDQQNDKMLDFSRFVDKIVAVTPDLTVDETFIFVKCAIPEAEFCRKFEELSGVKLVPVPGSRPVERRFTLEGNQLFPGIALKKRTFVLSFLTDKVAVIAKDSLANYWKIKEKGLSAQKQKDLNVPNSLAAGFAEISAEFRAENPYLPPIRRAVYSLSAGKDGSLRITASAVCADEKNANQTLMQVQQYVMVGGIVLNQLDPELMQEWLTSVKAGRDRTAVSLDAYFSKSFISRLAEASEKLAGTLNQPESAVSSGSGEKR